MGCSLDSVSLPEITAEASELVYPFWVACPPLKLSAGYNERKGASTCWAKKVLIQEEVSHFPFFVKNS